MKVDYIIVGLGLAGIAFTEELLAANKTVIVFEDGSQTSSLVAGGVYNPAILKRYTPVWNAKEQLEVALPFYENLEKKLQTKFDEKFLIKKVFTSIEDQNNWFTASDKPKLVDYLDTDLDTTKYKGIIANYAFGNVKQAGRIDTKKLVETYRSYLNENNSIRFEKFNYASLKITETAVTYQDLKATKIVFAEGFGIKENPFFNYLPLSGVKGELITIYAPDLAINFLLKSAIFILPLGKNYYKIGATFNWKDKTSNPTKEGKAELIEKLEKVLSVPYKIVEQTAGIRPTVAGRRPLVGLHQEHKNIAVLNGLGTRGVMIGPTVAKALYNYLEANILLDEEIDIKRFQNSKKQNLKS